MGYFVINPAETKIRQGIYHFGGTASPRRAFKRNFRSITDLEVPFNFANAPIAPDLPTILVRGYNSGMTIGGGGSGSGGGECDLSGVEYELAMIKSGVSGLQTSVNNANTAIGNVQTGVNTANSGIATNSSKIDALKGDTTTIKNGITTIQGDIVEIKSDIAEIKDSLGDTVALTDLQEQLTGFGGADEGILSDTIGNLESQGLL